MEQMNQVQRPQSEKHTARKPGRTQAQAGQNAGAKQRPRRMARTAPVEHGDAAPQRVKGAQNSTGDGTAGTHQRCGQRQAASPKGLWTAPPPSFRCEGKAGENLPAGRPWRSRQKYHTV